MAYNGTEGGTISRNDARQLMLDYRNSPAFLNNNQTEAILYGKTHIEDILSQTGCKGIRIYYGKSGPTLADPPQLILVGYDVDGNDMVEKIVDMGMPCPSHCPPITKI